MSLLSGEVLTRPSAAASAHVEGEYRYTLTRSWEERALSVCWVMLNPSTADALKDDPTIRRVVGFSRRWGFSKIVVVNLFALRSTNPNGLFWHADPVGPKNDETLVRELHNAQLVVAAWGGHQAVLKREREFMSWAPELHCVGVTQDGFPKHPLYAPYIPRPLLYSKRRP